MRLGLLTGLRRSRAVAGWLVALLLLPVVLGILPPAEVSAEEALARDLALSVCTPIGAQDHGSSPPSHDQQCVLCTTGCAFASPIVVGGAGVELVLATLARSLALLAVADALPHSPYWRDGAPPRGPPHLFIA
jgi:hypothetical protein